MPREFEDLLSHLNDLRTQYGEETYKNAATDIASSLIAQGGPQEEFARVAFKDVVDFSTLEATPPVDPALADPMLKAIQQAMPGVKTQAQLNAVMASFEVVKIWLNAVLTGTLDDEVEARAAFDLSLKAVRKATEIGQRLRDVPEAVDSPVMGECASTPKEFEEEALQQQLLPLQQYNIQFRWLQESGSGKKSPSLDIRESSYLSILIKISSPMKKIDF